MIISELNNKGLIICICVIMGILYPACSYAQTPLVDPLSTSPPVSVGSGARAQGMGGAFIAVADDATAASWNPGGLGQLQRPEMSVVGSYFFRHETHGGSLKNRGGSDSSSSELNYFSFAYARNIWRRNMFFSLNYQNLFDFSRKSRFEEPPVSNPYNNTLLTEKNNFQQEGSLYAFSPAMSVEIIPGLYLGLTHNSWFDHQFTGKSRWKGSAEKIFLSTNLNTQETEVKTVEAKFNYENFRGENWNLGFLWKITPQLQIGAVYKTPFRARVRSKFQSLSTDPNGEVESSSGETTYRIDFPAAYGIGLSYRIGNACTVAADVTRTEWQNYTIFNHNAAIGPFATWDGKVPSKDPTYTVRLGMEYVKILTDSNLVLPFRFGLFYDPEPSVKSPQDYYGVSCGFGVADNRVALDFAYQFRTGTSVNSSELGFDKEKTTNAGRIQQHFLLSSLIFYF